MVFGIDFSPLCSAMGEAKAYHRRVAPLCLDVLVSIYRSTNALHFGEYFAVIFSQSLRVVIASLVIAQSHKIIVPQICSQEHFLLISDFPLSLWEEFVSETTTVEFNGGLSMKMKD